MKQWTKWTAWRSWTKWTSVFVVVLFVAQAAFACPVCFGEDDSKAAQGMNNAILVLLGIVGAVQLGFVAMFWSFWRRSKKLKMNS